MKATSKTVFILFALLSFSAATHGRAEMDVKAENNLECAVCMEVTQSIDEFITEETTEEEILKFVESLVCRMVHTLCCGVNRKGP